MLPIITSVIQWDSALSCESQDVHWFTLLQSDQDNPYFYQITKKADTAWFFMNT